MNEFQSHSQNLIKSLEEKQDLEFKENREILEVRFQPEIMPSSELRNMRKIQFGLGKQKNYGEAHKIQVRCNQLEKEEQKNWDVAREKKIGAAEQKMLNAHFNEMQALQQRIENGESEQKKQRATELERMFQRYQNVKKDYFLALCIVTPHIFEASFTYIHLNIKL